MCIQAMTLSHMLHLPYCVSPAEVIQTKADIRLRKLTWFSGLPLMSEQPGRSGCLTGFEYRDIFIHGKHKQHGLQLCAKNSIMCLPRWHMSCSSSKKSKLYQKSETHIIMSNSLYLWRVLVSLISLDTELNMMQTRKYFFMENFSLEIF